MSNPRAGGDPEMVLRQAMRAMAGGRRHDPSRGPGGSRRGRAWTATQIMLLVAIIGLVLGMAAAFVVLLTR